MINENRSVRPRPSSAVRAEAAAWISRLNGPNRTSEFEAGLRRWLAEKPDNRRAFETMTQAWDDATAVASGFYPRVRAVQPSKPRLQFLAAAIFLMSAVAALAAYWEWGSTTYTTDIGELRTVRLDDGSRMSLNSGSQLVVQYRHSQRQLRLERGEALFEVSPNHARPFVVIAGDHAVTTLGTTFSVRYEPQQLAIILVEGKVAVTPVAAALSDGKAGDDAGRITLAPGDRLTLADTNVPRLDRPHVDAAVAWRRGEVVLDKTTLADAIGEMNRYDRTHLVVDDPGVAALQVSGIYRSGDNSGFARGVARMYGLSLTERNSEIHLSH